MDILPTIATGIATLAVLIPCAIVGCDASSEDVHTTEEIAADRSDDPEKADESSPEVLAVVNDHQITRKQVDERLERLDELYRNSRQPFDDSLRSKRRERVLQRLIERQLLREYARERDIRIADDAVARKLERRIDAKFGSTDAFERYLDVRDMSAGEYRRNIRDQMAIEAVLEEEAGLETIDEAQLREHYERIATRRPAGERVLATVIVVASEKAHGREERDDLGHRLDTNLDGMDDDGIEAFVDELETEFDVRYQKPRWFEASQLPHRAADVLFGEDVPDDGIATVDIGSELRIYRIHERRQPGIRGFDEVEDLLRERARRSLLERHRRHLLEDLRDEATITIHLPRRTKSAQPDSR